MAIHHPALDFIMSENGLVSTRQKGKLSNSQHALSLEAASSLLTEGLKKKSEGTWWHLSVQRSE